MAADPRAPIVDALADAFLDAWNRHDAAALAAVFSPDSDLVNFRGRRVSGKEEIQKFLTRIFAQNFRESQVAPGERRIRFVADTVASVDLVGTLTGMKDPTGGVRPPRSFRCDAIAVLNPKGGYWIVICHLREAPLETASPAGRPGPASPPGDPNADV